MSTSTSYHPALGYEPLPELFQTNFSRDELAARRAAVFDMIGPDDIALGARCASAGDLRVLPPDQRLLLPVGSRGPPLVLVARRPGADRSSVPPAPGRRTGTK